MKRLLFALLTTVCVLSAAACMSADEKNKAKDTEAQAAAIAQSYLNDNYGGGAVSTLKCVAKWSDHVLPTVSRQASPFVLAAAAFGGGDFTLLIDTINGLCYDDSLQSQLKKSLEDYVVDTTGVDRPDFMEIHYFPKDIFGQIALGRLDGFAAPQIRDAGLLLAGGYDVHIICKYIDSPMDFSAIDVSGFFPSSPVSSLSLSFVNFRNRGRVTDKDFYTYSGLNLDSEGARYWFGDVFQASVKAQDANPDPDPVKRYSHYESRTANNMEFVWEPAACDLDLRADGEGVVITCTERDSSPYGSPPPIYCFADKALYKKQLDIITTHDNESFTQKRKLEWRTNDYLFFWLLPPAADVTFELIPEI